jgi:hypothetical protein
MTTGTAINSTTAIQQELELIERFVGCYQKQLAGVIQELNVAPSPAINSKSLRTCVEAVNMMLATHGQLAGALKQLFCPKVPEKRSGPMMAVSSPVRQKTSTPVHTPQRAAA